MPATRVNNDIHGLCVCVCAFNGRRIGCSRATISFRERTQPTRVEIRLKQAGDILKKPHLPFECIVCRDA